MAQAAGFNSSSDHPAEQEFNRVQPGNKPPASAIPDFKKVQRNSHRLMRPTEDGSPWRCVAAGFRNKDGSVSVVIPEGVSLSGKFILQENRYYMGDEALAQYKKERALERLQEEGNPA
tara:strand:- start:65 stop:418 length:354 start_codon:yes stop_codon:yes gene_type:complete